MTITKENIYNEFLTNTNFVTFLQKNKLRMNIVDFTNYEQYKQYLGKTNICDPIFIHRSYELLSYAMMEEKDITGLFVTKHDENNNGTIILSLVINFTPEMDQVSIDTDFMAELLLLCSNQGKRIPKSARETILALQAIFAKWNMSMILRVAKGNDNPHASKFYENLDFSPLNDTKSTLLWSPSLHIQYGGMLRKVHFGSRGGKYVLHNKRRIYIHD